MSELLGIPPTEVQPVDVGCCQPWSAPGMACGIRGRMMPHPATAGCGPASVGGAARALQRAGDTADVHLEGDPDVGVAGEAGHIGDVHPPGVQRGGAEHVPQAVPGPPGTAIRIAPPGRQVSGLEDATVEVGGPPVLPGWVGNIRPSGLRPLVCSTATSAILAATFSASGQPAGVVRV